MTVTVSASHGTAIVRVADDGPGFPPEVAATAFERFSSNRNADGTTGIRHYGLGLAIVAEIVQRHHGTVTIDQPVAGASVTCTFRLARLGSPGPAG